MLVKISKLLITQLSISIRLKVSKIYYQLCAGRNLYYLSSDYSVDAEMDAGVCLVDQQETGCGARE